MASVVDELDVCVDCLFYVANGELPGEADRREAILAGVDEFAGQLVAGGEEDDTTFSWEWCDLCRSHLGGSRHRIFVLK